MGGYIGFDSEEAFNGSDDTATDSISLLDGWMTCDFTSFFNSISGISGRCLDDNERLCAMELRLRLRRFHHE